MKTLNDMMASLPEDRQARIRERAEQLLAEDRALRRIRKLFTELTQADVAARLNIGQDSVSRLENRDDLHLSTLAAYIQALGGSLELVVKFPDQPDYLLTSPDLSDAGR